MGIRSRAGAMDVRFRPGVRRSLRGLAPGRAGADGRQAGRPPKPPAEKKAADPSRRVPPLFGQIGLTPEQKEEIYKIRAKHQAQIESLQKQIAQLQAEMLAECEAVLTDSQKQLLALRREAAARARKAKAARPRPPPPSKPEKPAN